MFIGPISTLNSQLTYKNTQHTKIMDGEQPSWLAGDGGASSTPAAEPEPEPTPVESPAPVAASAPVSTSAEKAASAPTTDNVAGSILTSMQKDVNTTQANIIAASNEADEKELPRLILFMRILNMAAAALLITASVSKKIHIHFVLIKKSDPPQCPT